MKSMFKDTQSLSYNPCLSTSTYTFHIHVNTRHYRFDCASFLRMGSCWQDRFRNITSSSVFSELHLPLNLHHLQTTPKPSRAFQIMCTCSAHELHCLTGTIRCGNQCLFLKDNLASIILCYPNFKHMCLPAWLSTQRYDFPAAHSIMSPLYLTLNFNMCFPKLQFGGVIPSLTQFGFIVADRIDRCTLGNTDIA